MKLRRRLKLLVVFEKKKFWNLFENKKYGLLG